MAQAKACGHIFRSPQKKGRVSPPQIAGLWCLVHFVHLLAATLRRRLFGGHGLEGVALDADIGLIFLGLGRGFATARTTAHVVLLIWFSKTIML